MSDPEEIHCERHGWTVSTFVCAHLHRGVCCGFHGDESEEDRWPDAWCDLCEAAFEREGAWNDDNQPEITALCTHCYEATRERNRRVPEPLRPGQIELTESQVADLVGHAHRWCFERQAQTQARIPFADRSRWHFDIRQELLWFYDDPAGPAIVSDMVVVGSFSTRSATWNWGWANKNLADHVRQATAPLRGFGEVRGVEKMTSGYWDAEEVDAWEMAQVAAYLLGCEAIYRPPSEDLLLFTLLNNFRTEATCPVPLPEEDEEDESERGDLDPKLASITTQQVLDGFPVLAVYHDAEDGGWQFIGDTLDDPKVVGLGTMWERHPDTAKTADLPRGWKALRSSPEEPWERSPIGPEDYEDDDE